MGKIIPVILVLLGLGGGLAAGLFLRPEPAAPVARPDGADPRASVPTGPRGLFEIPNQFMVPVMAEDRIAAVIVITLALEIAEPQRAQVASSLPRLRDAMLQVMFDHANSGGFNGAFTANATMDQLRRALLEAGQKVLGPDVVFSVLVTDILRTGA